MRKINTNDMPEFSWFGESNYFPDSQKWIVRSPERRAIRSDALDYYDGEE
jgi:hypothetical protein